LIVFKNVNKIYPDGTKAVSDFSLRIEEGQTLVLLGTSGSGKTTTMKMVNRLIEPSDGKIFVAGEDIMKQDPISLRRNIGYAIQNIGLFPHMSVAENIAVVPRLLKWSDDKIDQRIDELLNLVGLDPVLYRDRYPSQLSGGQRQRIGVARALAADPPVVLMDEPFGALDPITREELQDEFIQLESKIKKTIIFVTHDVFEAVKMGDRIALLDKGVLQQLATPKTLVEKPANDFVDRFLGQHRFQLSLLTTKVNSLLAASKEQRVNKPPKTDISLSEKSSLIAALDLFKRTGQNSAPVFRGSIYLGDLRKSDLIKHMSNLLGEETGGMQ